MKALRKSRLARICGTALLSVGVAVALPAAAADAAVSPAATSPISTWPTGCNTWLEYQQFLYFYACAPGDSGVFGTRIQLLSFGNTWRDVCVRDNFIAKWDLGGYEGHQIASTADGPNCNWATSNPADRQPGS